MSNLRFNSYRLRSVFSGFTIKLCVIFFILFNNALAIEILCSSPKSSLKNTNANESVSGFRVANGFSNSSFSMSDVIDIFSQGKKTMGSKQVLICLFPAETDITKKFYESLGINESIIHSFRSTNSIVDRRVNIVHSNDEMIACVSSTYPSIGYIGEVSTEHENLICN